MPDGLELHGLIPHFDLPLQSCLGEVHMDWLIGSIWIGLLPQGQTDEFASQGLFNSPPLLDWSMRHPLDSLSAVPPNIQFQQ